MSFHISHKTVFVLDHSSNFAELLNQLFEFDTPNGPEGFIPLAPLRKSVWTLTVENVLEYCRIVWDIFPKNKLIRVVVCDESATMLNSWAQEQTGLNHLKLNFAQVGPAKEGKECAIAQGMEAAVRALTECSELQRHERTSEHVVNKGRIILITKSKSNSEIEAFKDHFHETLVKLNSLASSSDISIPIHYCELILIHMCPADSCSVYQENLLVSPSLKTELHRIKCVENLTFKLRTLVKKHYDFFSTVIREIPMKDEHLSSTALYDVELLHPLDAYKLPQNTGILDKGTPNSSFEINKFSEKIMNFRWSSHKLAIPTELQNCVSAVRITPIEGSSKPSSCLLTYLKNGDLVFEKKRKSQSRILSIVLMSHGEEIYIHTLASGRSVLEDTPSIVEGCGGSVLNYRIHEFNQFIKEHQLVPALIEMEGRASPIEKAKLKLKQHTKYWPIVSSNTVIFNIKALSPLLCLIRQETLTENEVKQCKGVLLTLLTSENENRLNLSSAFASLGPQSKGFKKKEKSVFLWTELETFVRSYCATAEHFSVLEYLQHCKKQSVAHITLHQTTLTCEVQERTESLREANLLTLEVNEENLPKKMKISANNATTRRSLLSLWLERKGANGKKNEDGGEELLINEEKFVK